ncbi:MAG TPA: beta-propeller fold lactonase family protein [Planctomycetaceae bacterium]|nr:beta-propeller fold lactonase family protein [Planctomycetaceae bacterium]
MRTHNQLRIAVIGAAIALFAIRTAAAGEFVYLENSDSGEVSVIDIPGHTLVSTIKVGPFLDDVTPSHDGRILYVNRYDSLGLGDKHVAESGEVIALSTETEQILWRTPVHGWPNHLTISLDDRLLYVPLFNTLWAEVIDTQEHKVVKKFRIGFGGHGTRLSPDGKRLYVGSMMTDVLSVFDLQTLKPVKVLPFKDAVRPFAFTRDESTVYVQLSRLHGFEVVDLSTDKIVREVLLPKLGPDVKLPKFYPHTYNHGLELSPDEKLLFASGGIANYVCVYRVPDLTPLATIPVGREPNWIAFSKDGAFAYVSNRKSDSVSVISVRDLKEIKRIPVGKYPQRIRVVDVPTRSVAAKPIAERGT